MVKELIEQDAGGVHCAAELERQGEYAKAALQYLSLSTIRPELTFYLDGFFRCFRRVAAESVNDANLLANRSSGVLGFVPRRSDEAKPKLAFVDHSYHAKTLSSMFFVELLRCTYNVDVFWSHSWRGIQDTHLHRIHELYQNIVYWQVFPDTALLRAFPKQNVIIVPMWDAVHHEPDDFFLEYPSVKFVSFAAALNKKLTSLRMQSLGAAPPVGEIPPPRDAVDRLPKLFFWPRTDDFSWNYVKKKIDPKQVGTLYLMVAPDPDNEEPYVTPRDIAEYNIRFLPWRRHRKVYLEILRHADIYIAPRRREGIGVALLDALSAGCVPIVHNEPTMNEIVSDDFGYVVDFDAPETIDLKGFIRKRPALCSHVNRMKLDWSRTAASVLEFVGGGDAHAGNWS